MISYFLIRHSVYITAYFLIWCPTITNMILRKDSIHDDENNLSRVSVVFTSSSGFILCLIRVISYYWMKSHMKFNNNLIRGSSIANIINDSIKLVPQAILLEDLSLIQGEYANVFNSVSTVCANSGTFVCFNSGSSVLI